MTVAPFDPGIAQEICALVAIGVSLRAIARRQGMPDLKTIATWRLIKPSFRAQIARARRLHAEQLLDEILAIARQLAKAKGADAGDAGRAKQRIDALKWVIERTDPAADPARKPESAAKPVERIRLVRVATGVPRAGD